MEFIMLNHIIIKTLPVLPKSFVYLIAKKYIAGPHLNDAIIVSQELMKLNGASTIDMLGEFVTKREEALQNVTDIYEILNAIRNYNLATYLSIKPTSLGMGIDFDFGYENIEKIVKRANELGIFVRLDMENSPYTDSTLKIYKKLRDNGYDKVGIVIQAYMRRSINDINKLLEYRPNIRLCKGIYNEDESIAYKGFEEIRDNYKKLLKLILDNNCYVGIATHDEDLIQFALNEVKQRNLNIEKYEFQMLLGVREQRRNEILSLGHHLRVYVPYGKDWYGYSTRRLKENPKMAGHIFKAIFGIGK